eukprot:3645931-Rhodomonas_salina.2
MRDVIADVNRNDSLCELHVLSRLHSPSQFRVCGRSWGLRGTGWLCMQLSFLLSSAARFLLLSLVISFCPYSHCLPAQTSSFVPPTPLFRGKDKTVRMTSQFSTRSAPAASSSNSKQGAPTMCLPPGSAVQDGALSPLPRLSSRLSLAPGLYSSAFLLPYFPVYVPQLTGTCRSDLCPGHRHWEHHPFR